MKFYEGEIEDIGIAAILLALAFSIAMFGLNEKALRGFLPSFIVVVPAFILHELMHKAVAQHYCIKARFIMFKTGVLLALVLSPLGVIFAAPGAVFIFARKISKDKLWKIAAAGPAMNILLSFMGLPFFGNPLAMMFIQINAFISLFNLIPFGPLDGRKILSGNKWAWVLLAFISGALLLVSL